MLEAIALISVKHTVSGQEVELVIDNIIKMFYKSVLLNVTRGTMFNVM